MVILSNNTSLVLYFSVEVKELFALGKSYPWEKPRRCPACTGGRLWGHGFATRYFEGFSEALWIKRYRCPECGAIHSTRPGSYESMFRRRSSDILRSLAGKLFGSGKWLSSIPRQNQQYWLKAVRRRLSIYSNVRLPTLETLKGLFVTPSTGSIESDITDA